VRALASADKQRERGVVMRWTELIDQFVQNGSWMKMQRCKKFANGQTRLSGSGSRQRGVRWEGTAGKVAFCMEQDGERTNAQVHERKAKRARTSASKEGCPDGDGDAETRELAADDDYESAEAWVAWEEEMKQYPGWENGGGTVISSSVVAANVSDPVTAELTSQLLEDMEIRASILSIMAEAGLPPETVRQIFASHVRHFTEDGIKGVETKGARDPVECKWEHGGRRVYLAHDEERNLHVKVFGWGRFRHQDIAFILKTAGNGPFIEMGAGSGWLAFLLRHAGAEIEAFDLQAQDAATFVQAWLAWPWAEHVRQGSVEHLHHASASAKTLLLCWPDMEANFASDCLAAYSGSKLVYIGEQRGGETAEDRFFEVLEREWTLLEAAGLSHRGEERDFIHVYARNNRHSTPSITLLEGLVRT